MSAAVDTAIRAKLTAITNIATLAPGGVHNIVRPQGSAFPVIVFAMVGSSDGQSFVDGGVEWIDYDVKCIAPVSEQANVATIVTAIHTALERVALTPSGVTHLQTLRQRRIPNYPETSGSIVYLHRGATYRVWVTA